MLANLYERLEAFRIVNGYGLFREMTKDRCEIILEGSADGIDWLPYEFKWKPGDVKRAPGWCAPHQPRLDWQMWFAALRIAARKSVVRRIGLPIAPRLARSEWLARKQPIPGQTADLHSRDVLSLSIYNGG